MTESDEYEGGLHAPVWTVFGDLMAGLVGAFVLVLVGLLVMQMDLVASLEAELAKRRLEEQRRIALEHPELSEAVWGMLDRVERS